MNQNPLFLPAPLDFLRDSPLLPTPLSFLAQMPILSDTSAIQQGGALGIAPHFAPLDFGALIALEIAHLDK